MTTGRINQVASSRIFMTFQAFFLRRRLFLEQSQINERAFQKFREPKGFSPDNSPNFFNSSKFDQVSRHFRHGRLAKEHNRFSRILKPTEVNFPNRCCAKLLCIAERYWSWRDRGKGPTITFGFWFNQTCPPYI